MLSTQEKNYSNWKSSEKRKVPFNNFGRADLVVESPGSSNMKLRCLAGCPSALRPNEPWVDGEQAVKDRVYFNNGKS